MLEDVFGDLGFLVDRLSTSRLLTTGFVNDYNVFHVYNFRVGVEAARQDGRTGGCADRESPQRVFW